MGMAQRKKVLPWKVSWPRQRESDLSMESRMKGQGEEQSESCPPGRGRDDNHRPETKENSGVQNGCCRAKGEG